MKNIKEFNSEKEFEKFIKPLLKIKIGSGSEGDIYLTSNNDIIKVMQYFYNRKYLNNHPDIIMSSDLKLDSFIFPDELYISNGIILGYKEKYFKNNIFDTYMSSNININNLKKAREILIEDAKIITDYGYRLYELPRNLMFDNKKLVAIDTLDYIKKPTTLKENIEIIDYAILIELADIYYDLDPNKPFDKEIQKIKK